MTTRSFLRHVAPAALAVLAVTAVASPAASDPSKGRSTSSSNAAANAAAANAGNGNPNPGHGNPNPGQGNPNPGHGNPSPGHGNAGEGNPNPGQGDPNLGHGTPGASAASEGNPNPGQGNPNPGQGNPNPGQGNPNPGQGNPGQGNPNPGQGNQGSPGDAGQGAARGNNGTVKVVMEDRAQHEDNEPHGCLYGLDFYNFDTGQTVDVVFSAHPPTGDKVFLFRVEDVVMGERGRGNEPNRATLTTDGVNGVGGTALGTRLTQTLTAPGTAFFFHPQQGWHVKVVVIDHDAASIDETDTRKSKVFWHRCPPAPPGGGGNPPGGGGNPPGGGGNPPGGGQTNVGSTTVTPGPSNEQGASPGGPGSPATPASPASDTARVAGVQFERPQADEAGRPTEVKGVSFERGSLARTGFDPIQLLRLGTALLLAGAAVATAGRRRHESDIVSVKERLAGY